MTPVADTRGYRDEGIDKPLNLNIVAQDIEFLMDSLQIQKAHAVIGVSLGGTTVLTFAIRYPDRLNKFIASDILINATLANSTAVDPRVTLAKEEGMAAIAPSLVNAWFTPSAYNSTAYKTAIAMVDGASPDGMQATSGIVNDFYGLENVTSLHVPGLYVVGAEDERCVPFMQGFVAANTPNAGLKYVEPGSHMCIMQSPQVWFDQGEEFLKI